MSVYDTCNRHSFMYYTICNPTFTHDAGIDTDMQVEEEDPADSGVKEIYFIGVIDFLSRYFLKKKTANFFKTFLWKADTLSTIPPQVYYNRWCDYLPTILIADEEEGKANATRGTRALTRQAINQDGRLPKDSFLITGTSFLVYSALECTVV
jgi:hypothetical protein